MDISIVIPARNAGPTIEACVEAVLPQLSARRAAEAIVVDNASTDTTRERLRRFAGSITVLEEPRRGASAARNAGVARARGKWIAFLDADCVPDPDWLERLHAAAESSPATDFIGGRIVGRSSEGSIARFMDNLYDQGAGIERSRPPYAVTANLMISKTRLQAFGGFDEGFLRGQDAELSFRAYLRCEATFKYEPAAVVRHAHASSLAGLVHKSIQHGQGGGLLWMRYGPLLGVSVAGRCLDLRPYRRLAHATFGLFRASAKSRVTDEALHPFFWGVVGVGKHWGFVSSVLSAKLGSREH